MQFREALASWTDSDVAAHALGESLDLFGGRSFTEAKGVFWTNNVLGNGLRDFLFLLVDVGVLEWRDGPTDEQFRWLLQESKQRDFTAQRPAPRGGIISIPGTAAGDVDEMLSEGFGES